MARVRSAVQLVALIGPTSEGVQGMEILIKKFRREAFILFEHVSFPMVFQLSGR